MSYYGGGHKRRESWGGSDSKRQRFSPEAEAEQRLTRLMAKVGDSLNGVEANVRSLAEALEAEVGSQTSFISFLCIQSTLDFPYRAPVYGTLIGLLNQRRPEFGQHFVERLSNELHTAIATAQMHTAKLLLRLLAELVNACVVAPSCLVNVLKQLIQAADDAADDQNSKDFWIWLAISTLPWCSELCERFGDDVSGFMEQLQGHMAARPKVSAYKSALATIANDESRDAVLLIWNAVTEMRDAKWPALGCFAHPRLQMQKTLGGAQQHEFALDEFPALTLNLPALRAPVLRLFDEDISRHEDKEGGLRTWEAVIMRSVIADMITNNSESHRDAATAIATIPLQGFRPRELVVETLFEELLKVAKRPLPMMYYCILTDDLCALDPKMEAYVGQAVDSLFKSAQLLDIESADTFAEWFALFLSEKKTPFVWDLWYVREKKAGMAYTWLDLVVNQDGESRHRMLLQEVLYRCARLSYYERVVPPSGEPSTIVPEGMHRFMPPITPSVPEAPRTSGEDGHSKLVKNIKYKMPPSDLMAHVDEQMAPDSYSKADRAGWVVNAILESETAIFSQMLIKFARYQRLLSTLANDLESKKAVVKAVLDFWSKSPQMSVILTNKLLVAGIADVKSIVHFLFSEDNAPRLINSYMFEILFNTLNIVVARTKKLQAEADRTNKEVDALEHLDDCPEKAISAKNAQEAKDKRDEARKREKELFLAVFERFRNALSQHISSCEASGSDPATMWFACMLARLRQVGRVYHDSIKVYFNTLDTLIFTASGSTDSRINDIFEGFREL